MDMSESGWESYRRGWRTAVVVLAALGLVTALVFVGWSTNVVAFLMGGTLVASVHLSVGLAQERQAADLIWEVLRLAARAGLCVVAIVGYATAIGVGTLWLVLLVAVTAPPLVSRLWPPRTDAVRPTEAVRRPPAEPKVETEQKAKPGRKNKKQPKVEPPPPPEPVVLKAPEPPDLAGLSDEDLCLAWRRSFTELQTCTTDEQRLAVVTARNAYLDELERRAPGAFSQWLDSGPRAAGNPAKFFSPRTNHGDPD